MTTLFPTLGLAPLWNPSGAFSHPVTRYTCIFALAALIIAPILIHFARKRGLLSPQTQDTIHTRHRTWLFLAPALLIPILISPALTIIAFAIFSLICYREFARATGLFRWRGLSALVALAIILMNFAALDNWYGFFAALPPLCVVTFAGLSVLLDEPRGYLQRVGLATFAFLLIGVGLAHLSFLANSVQYRPYFCIILLCTQGSDFLTFLFGRLFGARHIFRHTSPDKTIGGFIGSFIFIAPLAAFLMHITIRGTQMDDPVNLTTLAVFGTLIAICAQLGDLVIGSIKRDIGIKDMAGTLPGHGGFLDRFNSVLLVAPVVFHFLKYFDAI